MIGRKGQFTSLGFPAVRDGCSLKVIFHNGRSLFAILDLYQLYVIDQNFGIGLVIVEAERHIGTFRVGRSKYIVVKSHVILWIGYLWHVVFHLIGSPFIGYRNFLIDTAPWFIRVFRCSVVFYKITADIFFIRFIRTLGIKSYYTGICTFCLKR